MGGASLTTGPALLVVGHPGHELMVHGWLEAARPTVIVLTDGSGHTGISRLPSSAAVVSRAGAAAGSIFGRFTDAEVYRALLEHRTSVFADLVEDMARLLVDHEIAIVAGDDAEGFNPTHDVCRLVIDAAVRTARLRGGRPILNRAFVLMDAPDGAARQAAAASSTLTLSDAALERKLAAALGYPEMAREVAAGRERWGDEAFRTESFRHVRDGEIWAPAGEAPYYERFGQTRVDQGTYREVVGSSRVDLQACKLEYSIVSPK